MKQIIKLEKSDIQTNRIGVNFEIAIPNGPSIILNQEALIELIKDGNEFLQTQNDKATETYGGTYIFDPKKEGKALFNKFKTEVKEEPISEILDQKAIDQLNMIVDRLERACGLAEKLTGLINSMKS